VTVLVVPGSLIGVREDLVSFCGFFEFVDRVGISLIGIWVVLQRQLAIGLRDFVLGCSFTDPEDFVVIPFGLRRHGIGLAILARFRKKGHSVSE
jgi:hypothetical protein